MPHFQGSEANIWYKQVGNPDGRQLVWVGGGGTMGRDWHRFQTPHFAGQFRNLVFDNRGIVWFPSIPVLCASYRRNGPRRPR